MAGMSLDEFELRVRSACSVSPVVERVTIFASTESSILWRIQFRDGSFADVYYSESTGKTSFALIKGNKRIFGADNADGWHWHPSEDPEAHVPSPTEISFEEFLKKLELRLK